MTKYGRILLGIVKTIACGEYQAKLHHGDIQCCSRNIHASKAKMWVAAVYNCLTINRHGTT